MPTNNLSPEQLEAIAEAELEMDSLDSNEASTQLPSIKINKGTETQLTLFHFRINNQDVTKEQIIQFCESLTNTYVFQLEQAPSTRSTHYCGHLYITPKIRLSTLAKNIQQNDEILKPNYLEPENTHTIRRITHLVGKGIGLLLQNLYSTKESTRVGDTHYSQEVLAMIRDEERLGITKISKKAKELWTLKELNPLQKTTMYLLSRQTERQILVVSGQDGCVGKSALMMHLQVTAPETMINVPISLKTSEDIMQCVQEQTKGNLERDITIFLDIPRAEFIRQRMSMIGKSDQTEEQKLENTKNAIYRVWAKWAAIAEQLKSGVIYDKRYTWKQQVINPPKICIFSNEPAPENLLTKDRWVILRLDEIKPIPYKEDKPLSFNAIPKEFNRPGPGGTKGKTLPIKTFDAILHKASLNTPVQNQEQKEDTSIQEVSTFENTNKQHIPQVKQRVKRQPKIQQD